MGRQIPKEEVVMTIDTARLVSSERLFGSHDEEQRALFDMLKDAERYITSFRWCPPVSERYLGCGVAGIVAVFLFKFRSPIGKNGDEYLWVVNGDVPSAYLVTDNARDARTALLQYCDIVDEWAEAVLNPTADDNVFPVSAQGTKENANDLLSRTRFIREKVVPSCR